MKIGYLHSDHTPIKEGSSIQSWQIYSHLLLHNKMYVLDEYQFPGGIKSYKRWYRDLISYIKSIDVLFTIIDGSCNYHLEKFTVLGKYINPSLKTVWLINAPASEGVIFPQISRLHLAANEQWRRFAAKYTDIGICVSKPLQDYAIHQLHIKQTHVIPNGSDPTLFTPQKVAVNPLSSINKFIVFWSGNAEYPWQGIDKIVDVAKKIESLDSKIIFVIMTDHSYHEIPPGNNILQIPLVPYNRLPEYIQFADTCLCLYNNSPYRKIDMTFYNSPMKLFDYMSMAKPIIASNLGQISDIIRDRKNGMLTDNSADDIVRSILYIKRHKEAGIQMGLNARSDILHHYNWNSVSADIYKILCS